MNKKKISIEERWDKSRKGAWAARGFHYQHLVTTLVLVRIWAGEISPGRLVPEGLEDCFIEMDETSIFLQVKSKHDGEFSRSKVSATMEEVVQKSEQIIGDFRQSRVLCLEGGVSGEENNLFESFIESEDHAIYTCANPSLDIIETIIAHCGCVDQIAFYLADLLYARVADAATKNAGKHFDDRIGFSPADTGIIIKEFLNSTSGSYLADALSSGLVKYLDLKTEVDDSGFYLGVKAKPGHIAAGLILERPRLIKELKDVFESGRPLLIEGQSGAGKSALMWLLASSLQTRIRWFEISAQASLADAEKIITCLQARRPSNRSQIAVTMDEVGPRNADLWTHICDVVGHLPNIYIVGTIRIEDKVLIREHSELNFHRIFLDNKFAEEVWSQLKTRNLTHWDHWKEPFDQSDGLLLEYVHILTKGKRLGAVIEDQIAIRVKENRVDELSILRATSVLSALNAEIEASRLFEILELTPTKASKALKRLTNEHLVRESSPGVLGGLHSLRSLALINATHDEIVFQQTQSLLQAIPAVTSESLPEFILNCFRQDGIEEGVLISHFASSLSQTKSLNTWVGTLTGLGLASLDKHATKVISCLEKHNVQSAQRLIAAMISIAGIDASVFEKFGHMGGFCAAIEELETYEVQDLRKECLESVTTKNKSPDCHSFSDGEKFLRSITPLPGGPNIEVNFHIGINGEGFPYIPELASLMSVAFAVSPKIAKDIAKELGGMNKILSEFSLQTPWVSNPVIGDRDGQKILTCKHYRVSDDYQGDAHDTVIEHCETLLSICPDVDLIECDASTPNGTTLTIGDLTVASKLIGRKALPPKSAIAWNVSFGNILRSRISSPTRTEYALNISTLAERTEKAFRFITEKWIRGKNNLITDSQIDECNAIIAETNDQAYEATGTPNPHYTLDIKTGFESDTKGALNIGLLGNLTRRLIKSTVEGPDKAIALYALDLKKQARDSLNSGLWQNVETPPIETLRKIEDRVSNISDIMHELSTPEGDITITQLHALTKKSSRNKGVARAARHCRRAADLRFKKILDDIIDDLSDKGITARCSTRPHENPNSHYWPNCKIAIIIELNSVEEHGTHIEQALAVGKQHLAEKWRFCVVPIIDEYIITRAVLGPSLGMNLPVPDFAEKWEKHLTVSFPSNTLTQAFEDAHTACLILSGIISCCDLRVLHDEEAKVLDTQVEKFEIANKRLNDIAGQTGDKVVEECCIFLENTWNRWIEERDALLDGKSIENPLCESVYSTINGELDEQIQMHGVLLILLNEIEIKIDLDKLTLT